MTFLGICFCGYVILTYVTPSELYAVFSSYICLWFLSFLGICFCGYVIRTDSIIVLVEMQVIEVLNWFAVLLGDLADMRYGFMG